MNTKKNYARTFISLPTNQYEQLKQDAKRAGMTFSAYIRHATVKPAVDPFIGARVLELAACMRVTEKEVIERILLAYFAKQDAETLVYGKGRGGPAEFRYAAGETASRRMLLLTERYKKETAREQKSKRAPRRLERPWREQPSERRPSLTDHAAQVRPPLETEIAAPNDAKDGVYPAQHWRPEID